MIDKALFYSKIQKQSFCNMDFFAKNVRQKMNSSLNFIFMIYPFKQGFFVTQTRQNKSVKGENEQKTQRQMQSWYKIVLINVYISLKQNIEYNIFFSLDSNMESSEIAQNRSHSKRNFINQLVIRVHVNNQQEMFSINKIQNHELTTARRQSRSKSATKRRSTSRKIFATAHTALRRQTFLVNSKNGKQNSHFKTTSTNACLKSSLKDGQFSVKQNGSSSEKFEGITKIKLGSEKIDHQKLKNIIKKAQQRKTKHKSIKDLASELTNIIYGEECCSFEDRSFQFIDESSIHGEQNAIYFTFENEKQFL